MDRSRIINYKNDNTTKKNLKEGGWTKVEQSKIVTDVYKRKSQGFFKMM